MFSGLAQCRIYANLKCGGNRFDMTHPPTHMQKKIREFIYLIWSRVLFGPLSGKCPCGATLSHRRTEKMLTTLKWCKFTVKMFRRMWETKNVGDTPHSFKWEVESEKYSWYYSHGPHYYYDCFLCVHFGVFRRSTIFKWFKFFFPFFRSSFRLFTQ